MMGDNTETEQFLECGLCYENDDLKRLPCSPGHVYCVTCLTRDTAETQIVQCPQCKRVHDGNVDSIPSAAAAPLDKYRCCEVCLRKEDKLKIAQMYCVICAKRFCDTHLEAHNLALDDHRRIPMTEYLTEYRKLETRYCDKHPSYVYTNGCQKCYNVLCAQCIEEPGNCSEGSSHKLVALDRLAAELIRLISEKKVWIFDKEECLLGIIKQLTRVLSDWDTETEEMITNLHQARDKQIEEIRKKYDDLEKELIELRQKSKSEVSQYLDDDIGTKLNKLTRQVKKVDCRAYTYHQVDIVRGYKDTDKLIEELTKMSIPNYKPTKNHVELKYKDYGTEIGVTLCGSGNPLVTSLQLIVMPTSMTFIKEVKVGQDPISVCKHGDSTYVGLDSGKAVQQITGSGHLQKFANMNGWAMSVSVFNQEVFVFCDDKQNQIKVHDLSGTLLRSWSCGFSSSHYIQHCMVAEKIVLPDPTNNRLVVYSATGEIMKHLPCPTIRGSNISMASVGENSVIVSSGNKNCVFKMNIERGQIIWKSAHVANPEGVACYRDRFVLVGNPNTGISVLDIDSGEFVGVIDDSKQGAKSALYWFDIEVDGDTLILAAYNPVTSIRYYQLS